MDGPTVHLTNSYRPRFIDKDLFVFHAFHLKARVVALSALMTSQDFLPNSS
jgi:hypothetical protein